MKQFALALAIVVLLAGTALAANTEGTKLADAK